MINRGVTALCNLIPANWDFSHISPEQKAFPNERGHFYSLIRGQQQEPGPADLTRVPPVVSAEPDAAPGAATLNGCSSPVLCRSPWSCGHQAWPHGEGEQAGVSTHSQQPRTGLHTSAVPSIHHSPLTWPGSSLAGLPVVSQGVSLPMSHCSWSLLTNDKRILVRPKGAVGAKRVRLEPHPCRCSLI